MWWWIIAWIAVSVLVTSFVGAFIAYGMDDVPRKPDEGITVGKAVQVER